MSLLKKIPFIPSEPLLLFCIQVFYRGLMKHLIRNLVYAGLYSQQERYQRRDIIMLNRIHLSVTLIFLLVIVIIPFKNEPGISLYSTRFFLIILNSMVGFILNYNRRFLASKLILSINVPLLLVIVPTVMGHAKNEYFFWYAYAIVAISIINHFIFQQKQKHWLYIMLFVYLLISFFINDLLLIFSDKPLTMAPFIKNNEFFYKMVLVIVFVFLNGTLLYLFSVNNRFEKLLSSANQQLSDQSEELNSQNEQLRQLSEELAEQNEEVNATLNQLKKTQAQLVRTEKMASLGTLTTGIAHQINNPLNFIAGSMQALKQLITQSRQKGNACDCCAKEEVNQLVDDSLTGVERVSKVVNSLMSFASRKKTNKQSVDIRQLIESTWLIMHSHLPDYVKVEKKWQRVPPVQGQPDQLHQVVLQLLDNAIYSLKQQTQGHAVLSLQIEELMYDGKQWVRFAVCNSGAPIPVNHMQHLFDPFFTTKEPDKSTGLGLSIAYSIVQEHGGRLYVKNEQEGVCFYCELTLLLKSTTNSLKSQE